MRELPVIHDNCVARVPIFNRLTAEQQHLVASYARPVSLGSGELLHGPNRRTGQLFVVHTGRMKVTHLAPSGRSHLLRVVSAGEVVGEHDFLTGERPDYQVEAIEDARLCVFDHADLARLVAKYPVISVTMLRSLSDRLTEAERRLSLSAIDVASRVADYLLELRVIAPNRTQLPLPKKDIASWLGTTPESLSRALARLVRDGLIRVNDAEVEFLDPERLQQIANGAP